MIRIFSRFKIIVVRLHSNQWFDVFSSFQLTVVRQRDKLEPWFKHYLVEDKGFHANQLSYVDFLCHVHKEIRNLLS